MSKRLLKLIPSRVRIKKDITYEVVFIDNFSDPKQVGECRHDPKQIVIKKDQSPTELFSTLIHETLHAISFEYPQLNLTENQVLLLEKAILKMLKLNKLLDLLFKLL